MNKFFKHLLILSILVGFSTSAFAAGFAQVIVSGTSDTPSAGSTNYISPMGSAEGQWNTTEANRQVPIPITTTLSNIYYELVTAPSVGKSRGLNMMKNGSSTSMPTCTISDTATTANDLTTTTGSFSPGDLFDMRSVPSGNPTTSVGRWSFISTPSTTGIGMTLSHSGANAATGATNYVPISGMGISATVSDVYIVMPFAGTFKNLYVAASGVAGASKSYTVTLQKIGTGNTTLTAQVTGAVSATANDTTHTVSFSAGDVYVLEVVPAGTPTARFIGIGIEVDPTTDGHFLVAATGSGTMSTSTTNYTWGGSGSGTFNATESNRYSLAQAMTTKAIYINLPTGLGGTGSYAFTLMNNGVASSLACTVSGLLVATCNAATDVTISNGVHFDTKVVPSTTPLSDTANISYDCYNAPPSPGTNTSRFFEVLT